MKYLFVILLLISNSIYAQLDTISFSYTPMSFIAILDKPKNEILIVGDTMKAIKSAMEGFKDMDSTIKDLRNFLSSAISVINNTPDVWRTKENNCAWAKFSYLLKKHGYITVKNKSKKDCY